MSIFKKIFGDESSRFFKDSEKIVKKINDLEPEMVALKDQDFPEKTLKFKERLANGEKIDDILPEAFALTREAAKRNLGERHYDVQLIGGLALHFSKIAEMKTGEGKTLVATLPAYLNALTGNGVHIVTVNDYLARRDAVLMGQIYNFLGMTVGVINSQNVSYLYDASYSDNEKELKRDLDEKRDKVGEFKIEYDFLKPCSRKEAYKADIIYGTNHEYGFDYLRDNLVLSADHITQSKHFFAIVDEVDSILIDEARTPLIISSTASDSEDFYIKFSKIARQLQKDVDYFVDEKLRAITITDVGIDKAEKSLGLENIYTEKGIKYAHHLEVAVKAQSLFQRDKDYVVKDGEVVIVDPFTGRLQPGRRWSEGIHQAIEAKEGVKIEKETRSSGSITFQNYFRLYEKLAGMTGTAETSAEEFLKVYGLDVIVIPTNKPVIRADHPDLIFQNERGKFQAISRRIKEIHANGQPILIGTVSIEKNELLSTYLKQNGIPHVILNAKNHEKEGEIIAQAGKFGAVTIATNMAGRGIDIKLGGNPIVQEEYEKVKKAGGLFVLGTERHEARRIDNQLRGRSGRQGDPGETQFFVSLEDDLMRIFAAEKIKNLMGRFGIPEDQPIENRFVSRTLEGAQEKIEGFHFDSRKHVLEYDDVMNHQRKIIYERRHEMLNADQGKIESFIKNIVNIVYKMKDQKILENDENIEKIIKEKRSALGDDLFFNIARRIILYTIDVLWMEHLESMDHLRSSVGLRAYGQHEPIVEYKKEGLKMFQDMEKELMRQILSFINSINVDEVQKNKKLGEEEEELMEPIHVEPTFSDAKDLIESKKSDKEKKQGRNEACHCGSGKKYKKCHGK